MDEEKVTTTKQTTPTPTPTPTSNINYLGAVVFTLGCAVLVVNAVLSFLPLAYPKFQPSNNVIYVEGALSLMSNALFLTGSAFAFMQILNAKHGEQDERESKGGEEASVNTAENNEKSLGVESPFASTDNLTTSQQVYNPESDSNRLDSTNGQEVFRYMPSTHEVWIRSIHEIGFLATTIFFCSSAVYFSSSIASIVTIAQIGQISRWIRYPQLVAALGFAIASIILMIQAQEKWWQPAWHRLRWYVNFWNLVGSCGFIACAGFGLVENVYWAKYQFGMSYLWGSWAFLFGSLMQWYKSLGKRAIDRVKEWG